LSPGAGDDNSINALAINSTYLFYWDGKNLNAFNKATGDPAGAGVVVASDTVLRQGGIIADECGNVFVGDRQGIIKVYKFDGATFNDAAAPDITVTGYTAYNSVYDLAFDDSKRILYASGRGFVASFDVSSYCTQATYKLNIVKNCNALSATATLAPSPPAGSTLDYVLYNGSTQISTNTTGLFTGLTLGTTYTIKAIINQSCSGLQTVADFIMGGPRLTINKTPACGSNGSFTVDATDGTTPYSFSIDGGSFQNSNTFSNLTPNIYNLTVKDANGCVSLSPVTVVAGTNCVSATAVVVDENCGIGNGSITITTVNGMPPYLYSVNGGSFQSGNVFNNLPAGNYTIQVKDAGNGTFDLSAKINSINNNNLVFAHTETDASCQNNDGSITATGAGGVLPFQFNLNGGTFQNSGVFRNLSTGNYIVIIKDANGCTFSQQVTVPLINNLTVDAGTSKITCEGDSILLNASSNGTSFLWTPAAGISATTLLQPKVAPAVTTQYFITAKWGPCTLNDSVIINVKPAPKPVAADTSICFGKSVMLNASGGVSYTWTPATWLSDPTIANPQVIKPASTITYSLSAVGANNCTSVKPAKIKLTVTYPIKVFAGNDTVALVNEALQLTAIDFNNNPAVNWLWTPSTGLSNPFIPDPVFLWNSDISYLLTAITPEGCEAQDSIIVKVYKFADIFVPTAFSPNGDGKNEVLKAMPVGIKKFNRFSVYNRWGQLLFTTTDASKGWDGKIAGVLQSSAVFVWITSGVDFKGRLMERKGSTVLIR
jgi:gliding motility-associated-like protein